MAKRKTTRKTTNDKVFKIVAVLFVLFVGLFFYSGLQAKQKQVDVKVAASQTDVKEITAFVDDAVTLIEKEGERAYAMFREKDTKWRLGDRYIFVYDMEGNTLVLPSQPELEGTNRYWVKDPNGVYFVKEMVDTLSKRGSGWVKYDYPRPGEEVTSSKLSFFRKATVEDKTVIVGSGLYLD